MPPLRLLFHAARYLGPRIVCKRAGVYLRNQLGITRRAFRPRPWNTITLDEITAGQVRSDADYARLKSQQELPFCSPCEQRSVSLPAEFDAGSSPAVSFSRHSAEASSPT